MKRHRTDREIVLSAIRLMDRSPRPSELIDWLSGMEQSRVSREIRSMIDDGTLAVDLNWRLVIRDAPVTYSPPRVRRGR